MTRYFYDLEFLEDGRTIDPISVGIVAENGREYYAVFEEIVTDEALHKRIGSHKWLMDNVVPHLPLKPDRYKTGFRALQPEHKRFYLDMDSTLIRPRRLIRAELLEFLRVVPTAAGQLDEVELWGYYPAYDHVALAQLLGGPMVNLPEGIPFQTHDVWQEMRRLGVEREALPPNDAEHNALDDARWTRAAWKQLLWPEAAAQRIEVDA